MTLNVVVKEEEGRTSVHIGTCERAKRWAGSDLLISIPLEAAFVERGCEKTASEKRYQ